MISSAKDCGADAIKFQVFKADNIALKRAKKAEYQLANTGSGSSQYEMLKRLELGQDDFENLADYAKEKNIIFFASAFDKESVDLLKKIRVPIFKIASGEITNLPLIEYAAGQFKSIILSTGMSSLKEIWEALGIIKAQGRKDIVLLHCVTGYPIKPEEANLKVMQTLKETFNLPVGFSDHTLGIAIPIAAVALGACAIEKHFTLNKKFTGPDHKASLEPDEFKEMVEAIRQVEKALGNGIRKLIRNEEKIKVSVRRSIVAKKAISKGIRITEDMLDIKRPGIGLQPKYLNQVIGKIARNYIEKDTLITLRNIREA